MTKSGGESNGEDMDDISRGRRITLFVNRQGLPVAPTPPAPGNEGMTFAIWVPWKKGAF